MLKYFISISFLIIALNTFAQYSTLKEHGLKGNVKLLMSYSYSLDDKKDKKIVDTSLWTTRIEMRFDTLGMIEKWVMSVRMETKEFYDLRDSIYHDITTYKYDNGKISGTHYNMAGIKELFIIKWTSDSSYKKIEYNSENNTNVNN